MASMCAWGSCRLYGALAAGVLLETLFRRGGDFFLLDQKEAKTQGCTDSVVTAARRVIARTLGRLCAQTLRVAGFCLVVRTPTVLLHPDPACTSKIAKAILRTRMLNFKGKGINPFGD